MQTEKESKSLGLETFHDGTSIINHFWYSCRNSEGDGQKLIEIFHSFLLHISNSHTLTTGAFSRLRGDNLYPRFTSVLKCAHGKLQKIHLRRGNWVKRTSPTFKELFEKVTSKQLTEDMMHCCEFLHTGSLENYHNVRLKYLPKRVAFTRETTVIRSMIAIIETNRNVKSTTSFEKPKMYARYSKKSAKWVLRKGYKEKDYTYRDEILASIVSNIRSGENLDVNMSEYIPELLPKNMAPIPKPPMQQLLGNHKSRMNPK